MSVARELVEFWIPKGGVAEFSVLVERVLLRTGGECSQVNAALQARWEEPGGEERVFEMPKAAVGERFRVVEEFVDPDEEAAARHDFAKGDVPVLRTRMERNSIELRL